MIRVGLVGIGFMGWIHQLAYRRSNSARLAAFCTSDAKKRSGDWTGIQGNFGPPGQPISMEGIETFDSLESMVRSPNIDVIDICLPPYLHASAAILAMEHGKDVLCEKPLALHPSDCQRIMQVAQKTGRMTLVAHVLPYMGAFAYATEVVRAGTYGAPLGGYFKRIITDPTWLPDFYDKNKVGGPLVDLHVHDLHWIQLLFGKPKGVQAVGRMKGDVAKFVHVLYDYGNRGIAVSSTSGVIDGPGRPFTHGFELHLEQATLQHEFAAYSDAAETMPLKIVTSDGQVIRPELPAADEVDAFRAEIDDMAVSVTTRIASPRLDGALAAESVALAIDIQDRLAASTSF
jgi:predicted dehydrogenase